MQINAPATIAKIDSFIAFNNRHFPLTCFLLKTIKERIEAGIEISDNNRISLEMNNCLVTL